MESAVLPSFSVCQVDEPPQVSTTCNEQRVLQSFLQDVTVLEDHNSSHSSLPPKKKSKPNLSWKRRKEELGALRVQAEQMQSQLAYLEIHNTHTQLLDECGGLSDNELQWKTRAANEKKQWQLASRENARLKEKVQMYEQISNTLQIVLTAADLKSCEQFVTTAFAERALRTELRTGHRLDLLAPVVFDILQNAVRLRCIKVESIVQESQVSMPRADTDQVQIYLNDDETTVDVMEFKRTHVLPYPAEMVGEAIWRVTKMGVIPDERSAKVTAKEDDMVEVEGCFSLPLDHGSTVDVRAYCLMKRVTTAQGSMVLIETSTEWSSSSEKWKHVTRGSGWAAAYPLDPNGSAPGVSQVRTVQRLQASNPGGGRESKLNRNVSEEIAASFRKMTRTRHQLLDNALLDFARRAVAVSNLDMLST